LGGLKADFKENIGEFEINWVILLIFGWAEPPKISLATPLSFYLNSFDFLYYAICYKLQKEQPHPAYKDKIKGG